MAEFPPNLDDGELWLPSNIFFPEEVPGKLARHSFPELSCIEDLSHRFALCTSLHQCPSQHRPSLAPNVERIRVPIRYGPVFPLPKENVNGGLRVTPRNFWGHGTPEPLYDCRTGIFNRVEYFLEMRASILQRQQLNRVQTGRFLPPPKSESLGTGVFLPRAGPNAASSIADARKKQDLKSNRQESMVRMHKGSTVPAAGVGKQQQSHCQQLSPEMVLPQDWTY